MPKSTGVSLVLKGIYLNIFEKQINMKYKKELDKLKELRAKTFHIDLFLLIIFIINAFAVWYSVTLVSMLCGLTAIIIVYNRMLRTAHYPCPKCEQPFGNKSKFVFNLGGKNCQNCGLTLDKTT